jgi:putative flippase GtrA
MSAPNRHILDKDSDKLKALLISVTELTLRSFRRFCCVGMCGFIADASAFWAINQALENTGIARLLSFWLAVSITWYGNRLMTFPNSKKSSPFTQWSKHFLIAHLAGSANLAIFWLSINLAPLPIAFTCGVAVGLACNYLGAKYFTFRH